MKGQELEIKVLVDDSRSLEKKLIDWGADCIQPRVHELNLRFDTPDLKLTRTGQALRLRKDVDTKLTYKGAGLVQGGVHARREIEFSVGNYDAARDFILALGYEVSFIYEKYRTIYELNGVDVMIDEMPFGTFIEIEGPTPESIEDLANQLGIQWEKRVIDSYAAIFDKLKQMLDFPFRDLTFENFKGLNIPLEILGITYGN